ncbi:MAG: endopeptidase La [Pseudomonadota bacterium]|nr:endopeptidase La [Pseudomonadota bacterium]MEC7830660.1 endopeptidase La [Pseudomonadota bacterium]MEC9382628.1 endopeptidase La [Pseudomonadota bacterium]MEC9481384.1 endopeptidase La [Pseudomonadota bacterium]
MKETNKINNIPVLPLRNIVVFPNMIVPLFVGRDKSINALEKVMDKDQELLFLTQKNSEVDDPEKDDLYKIGTRGKILQLLKLPDGTVKVLVEGKDRCKVENIEFLENYIDARVSLVPDLEGNKETIKALARSVKVKYENYAKINNKVSSEVLTSVKDIEEENKLSDTVASQIAINIQEKQKILEEPDLEKRLNMILTYIEGELSVLQVEKKIRRRVKNQMEKTQKEYYLNEQMKAIQKELEDGEGGATEDIAELIDKINKTKLSKEAKEKAENELKKLKQMSPMSAEATVVRNYLDWLLDIPWGKKKRIKKDINKSQEILDKDHYGLEKVKDRITEYLAVQNRSSKVKGPILCLVGPPGVGKTSLGKSIANATGREFIRMSLGGVRDEAEIRGHRRTYIGSMPGRIIQALKKVKTTNPVFLLDEIDKLGQDFRGDPASALLEVLDPEQNNTFNDHYLEVDYDLSQVMFVTTANTMNIPAPLLDRMEIIRIAGYTEEEKLEIAKRHLLEKVKGNNALEEKEFDISDDVIRSIIRNYTREAGVRSLERELNSLGRKAVKEISQNKSDSLNVSSDNISDYLGVKKFRYGKKENDDLVGVVTGLAWTEVGGDILNVEAVMVPGQGKIRTTGKLGEVMKESIDAASSFVRSRAVSYGIEPPIFQRKDIHVHVPEGATPKDGPSAGVAMIIAIISVMAEIPVKNDVAMTGEMTLRGRILPIGGLKEKLLAALRSGIKTVLIPSENDRELSEVPENIKEKLDIKLVSTIDEALELALVKKPDAIDWDEDAWLAEQKKLSDNQSNLTAH